MANQDLYDNALEAINKLFGDTSVSVEQAIENMEGLKSEIEIKLECLAVDLEAQQDE